MHRINLVAPLLVAAVAARGPVRARRDVDRRRQPGLRRRRQRRRDVPERLRRALQPRQRRRRPHGLDGAVRVRDLDELVGDAAQRLDPAGPALPRPARVDGRRRRAAAGAGGDRDVEPRRVRRQGRARPRRDGRSRAARRRAAARAPRSSRISSATARRPTTRAPARRPRSRARPRPCGRAEAAPTPTRTPPTSRRPRLRRATARLAGGDLLGNVDDRAPTASAGVDVELAPFLSVALERSSISFGQVFAGQTPPPVSERVTVVSNNAAGYVLTVHRTAFAPADLPLGIAPSATAALAPIPVAPAADLVLASTVGARRRRRATWWPASVGFTSALPVAAAGPLHVDDHVHGDRPVIVAPPPAALTRVACTDRARRRRRPHDPRHESGPRRRRRRRGPGGFGLDLRGRPRIVVRRDPAVRVSVSPGSCRARPGCEPRRSSLSPKVGAPRAAGRPRAARAPGNAPARGCRRRRFGCRSASSSSCGCPARSCGGSTVRGVRVRGPRRLDVDAAKRRQRRRAHRPRRRCASCFVATVACSRRFGPAPRELLPGARGIVEARYPRRCARPSHRVGRGRRAGGGVPAPPALTRVSRKKKPKPVSSSFGRGGCSHATGASLRSTLPTAPGLRRACTLHDDGARSSASLR